MKITNNKKMSIANILLKKISEEIDTLINNTEEKVYNALLPYYPKDLLESAKKYPECFNYFNCVYLPSFSDINDYGNSIYLAKYKLPHYNGVVKNQMLNIFDKDNDIYKEVIQMQIKIKKLEKKEGELSNKIRCTLDKLNTYEKLKMEFPEAYQILVTQVDKNTESQDNCTDIEKLRAELNKELK